TPDCAGRGRNVSTSSGTTKKSRAPRAITANDLTILTRQGRLQKMGKRIAIPMLSLLLFATLLAGCSRSSASGANVSASATVSQTIRVGTNRALGTVVPFVANEKGFFRQQG